MSVGKSIVIGKIVAPHGVRGDIRILPLTEKPEQFLSLTYLLLPEGLRLQHHAGAAAAGSVVRRAGIIVSEAAGVDAGNGDEAFFHGPLQNAVAHALLYLFGKESDEKKMHLRPLPSSIIQPPGQPHRDLFRF